MLGLSAEGEVVEVEEKGDTGWLDFFVGYREDGADQTMGSHGEFGRGNDILWADDGMWE